MSNQITFSINVSDQLLDKLLMVMVATQQQPTTHMGGMGMQQMIAMAMQQQAQAQTKTKAPIGFGREHGEQKSKETKKE